MDQERSADFAEEIEQHSDGHVERLARYQRKGWCSMVPHR